MFTELQVLYIIYISYILYVLFYTNFHFSIKNVWWTRSIQIDIGQRASFLCYWSLQSWSAVGRIHFWIVCFTLYFKLYYSIYLSKKDFHRDLSDVAYSLGFNADIYGTLAMLKTFQRELLIMEMDTEEIAIVKPTIIAATSDNLYLVDQTNKKFLKRLIFLF